MIPAPKRIIIIGDAGRGKSTLAKKLSEKLNIPHYSTDDFFYEVKFSKHRSREGALALAEGIYQKERWIVEGTAQWLLKPGLDASDLIIYLRYKNIFHQWYTLFVRYLNRKEETFLELLGLMRHVFYKRYNLGYKKGAPTHSQVIAPHRSKVVILSSFREIDQFCVTLSS
jgi:adenylate kinase family enzyme